MRAGVRKTTIFMENTFLSAYVNAVIDILWRRCAKGAGLKSLCPNANPVNIDESCLQNVH